MRRNVYRSEGPYYRREIESFLDILEEIISKARGDTWWVGWDLINEDYRWLKGR